MSDVRALSLHQPWASLIALGVKSIETRSWSTKYRGRLLIHAAVNAHAWERIYHYAEGSEPLVRAARDCVQLCADLPLGAVVASCVLIDCVPMIAALDCGTNMNAPPHLCGADGDVMLLHRPQSDPFPGGETERVVTDQRPFGDFAPGRFAWLLGDVKPTTGRCPRCWATSRTMGPGDPCPTCRDYGGCEPVPMRGRQRLWEPSWGACDSDR